MAERERGISDINYGSTSDIYSKNTVKHQHLSDQKPHQTTLIALTILLDTLITKLNENRIWNLGKTQKAQNTTFCPIAPPTLLKLATTPILFPIPSKTHQSFYERPSSRGASPRALKRGHDAMNKKLTLK